MGFASVLRDKCQDGLAPAPQIGEGWIEKRTYHTGQSEASAYFYNRRLFWSQEPTEIRLLLSHRNWEIGLLAPLIFTFQRDGFQVLEKDIPWSSSLQIANLVFKRIYVYFTEI